MLKKDPTDETKQDAKQKVQHGNSSFYLQHTTGQVL